jgi:hypothetical protein
MLELAIALSLSFLISVRAGATSDYWVFVAGIVAGVVIVVAIRRDISPTDRRWDGRDRRRAK